MIIYHYSLKINNNNTVFKTSSVIEDKMCSVSCAQVVAEPRSDKKKKQKQLVIKPDPDEVKPTKRRRVQAGQEQQVVVQQPAVVVLPTYPHLPLVIKL
jgi:hypothetical protein